jgi:hypothetical protein
MSLFPSSRQGSIRGEEGTKPMIGLEAPENFAVLASCYGLVMV